MAQLKNNLYESELSSHYDLIQQKVVHFTHLGHKLDIALTNMSEELESKDSDEKLIKSISEYYQLSNQIQSVITTLRNKLVEDTNIQWPSPNT